MPAKKHLSDELAASVVVECKHSCKHKDTCGHACCKRHLSPISQLKSAQLSEASSYTNECKHKCSDRSACGHQCCKRHLSREVPAVDQPAVNLQVVTQGAHKAQQHPSNHALNQVRRSCSGPQLRVQGRSVVNAKEGFQARCADASCRYHFFVYDIESTGTA